MALKMRSFLPYLVPKAQVKELWSCRLVSIPPMIQFHLNHSQSPPSYLEGSAMEKMEKKQYVAASDSIAFNFFEESKMY